MASGRMSTRPPNSGAVRNCQTEMSKLGGGGLGNDVALAQAQVRQLGQLVVEHAALVRPSRLSARRWSRRCRSRRPGCSAVAVEARVFVGGLIGGSQQLFQHQHRGAFGQLKSPARPGPVHGTPACDSNTGVRLCSMSIRRRCARQARSSSGQIARTGLEAADDHAQQRGHVRPATPPVDRPARPPRSGHDRGGWPDGSARGSSGC